MITKLQAYADDFYNQCIVKISFIKKMPNGKWRVVSRKGKNLGEYDTKQQAVKRLQTIEFWKNKKASTNVSYSAISRELNKNNKDLLLIFQKEFKKSFDESLLKGEDNPEEIALEAAIHSIDDVDLLSEASLKKIASAIDLGDPAFAGKYLSDLVKFLLRRISDEHRPKSIDNLKKKIYYLNEYNMAGKKVPPSSALGQSITLLKTILLEHSPGYIREVLNSIVRNL